MAKRKERAKAAAPRPLTQAAAGEQLARLGLRLTPAQVARLQPDLEALARNLARIDELELHDVALPVTPRPNPAA